MARRAPRRAPDDAAGARVLVERPRYPPLDEAAALEADAARGRGRADRRRRDVYTVAELCGVHKHSHVPVFPRGRHRVLRKSKDRRAAADLVLVHRNFRFWKDHLGDRAVPIQREDMPYERPQPGLLVPRGLARLRRALRRPSPCKRRGDGVWGPRERRSYAIDATHRSRRRPRTTPRCASTASSGSRRGERKYSKLYVVRYGRGYTSTPTRSCPAACWSRRRGRRRSAAAPL